MIMHAAPFTAFDHLVIGARDLTQADAWARDVFGEALGPGGAHPLMGTHNLLARMAAGYLEAIAVDPAAPPPGRARWYGLDKPATQARLAVRPRPIAWVLAVEDLDAAAARATWDVGRLIEARRGDLVWRISVPDDGASPEGVLPTLIEWPESLGRRAPTGRMSLLSRTLGGLKLRHPEPERIAAALASVDAESAAQAAGFALSVHADASAHIEAAFRPTRLHTSI